MVPIDSAEDAAGRAERAKPIRILIADDHPVVREGLCTILNRQPDMEVVSEASNGVEAVGKFLRHLPDVTLMDLRMPDLDGAGAVSRIRAQVPAAKIVIMSAYESEDEVCTAILAGAEGFLPKASSREQLVGCIREVYAGKKSIPLEIMSALEHRAGASNQRHR